MVCKPFPCGCSGCVQCSDYYDPSEWFLWLDSFGPPTDNSGNINTWHTGNDTENRQYYWSDSNLHTVLNNLLANFQFTNPPTNITGPAKRYSVSTVSFSGVTASATLNYQYRAIASDPWSPWITKTVVFSEFEYQQIYIDNICGGDRRGHTRIKLKIDTSDGSGHTTAGEEVVSVYAHAISAYENCSTLPLTELDPSLLDGYLAFRIDDLGGTLLGEVCPLIIRDGGGTILFWWFTRLPLAYDEINFPGYMYPVIYSLGFDTTSP